MRLHTVFRLLSFALLGQISLASSTDGGNCHGLTRRANSTESEEQIWSAISPGTELAWYPCYAEPLQCARLQVPLDYSDPTGRQAVIALVRKPAATQEGYGGPVLFNPGGPGTSGVSTVVSLGDALATILGPQFDIVSFDPRGVGRSTPRANHFNTDVERAIFAAGGGSFPIVKDGAISGLQGTWAQSRLLGSLAASHDDGYLGHITTENTATDMLRIVQAYGEEKLQYWGFSYGSVIGSTFAAMYPDKIKRLVIDGVVDADDYYSNSWLTSLADIDKALDLFFDNCAAAGPESCAFYSADPADIRRKLMTLQDKLLEEPITVNTGDFYGVVDYSMLRFVLFRFLYSPLVYFKPLADALAQLTSGNGTALISLMGQPKPYACDCDPQAHAWDVIAEGATTIACNDGAEISGSLEDLAQYGSNLASVSQYADFWVTVRAECVNWPKNKKPFRGPFVGNTSHPILLIGNTADPVTPLRSAHKMAQGFQNSVVLTIDGVGHCSISAPSLCAQQYTRQYFQNGTLPEPGTVCDPIVKNPFLVPSSVQEGPPMKRDQQDGQSEESSLRWAVMEAANKFQPQLFPSSRRWGF